MNSGNWTRRDFLVAAATASCGAGALAGIQPNEVPMQDAGVRLAMTFLGLLDQGDDRGAYNLMSTRVRRANSFDAFAQQLRSLRSRLGGRGGVRQLVGSNGIASSARAQMPNVGGQAQWTVRFRNKYPAGALFEDVHLEFDERRAWAVAGWYFGPASF